MDIATYVITEVQLLFNTSSAGSDSVLPAASQMKIHPFGKLYLKVIEKAFHKMQKHVGLASTKNQPNKMGLT